MIIERKKYEAVITKTEDEDAESQETRTSTSMVYQSCTEGSFFT